MKKHIAVIVSLFITSVTGFSQDFLNRYQQLDENNIEHFFKDWKHYSDSCANNIVIKDTMVFNFVNKIWIFFILFQHIWSVHVSNGVIYWL